MAGNRRLTVEVLGDAKGAVSALDKVGASAGGMGSKLASFGKTAAIGFLGAGTAAVAFGKAAIDAAAESAKVGKQTEAIIKATGGSANITADQVGQLATKLSNLTGVDDELVQTSANLLLTFKGVRNEVGAGNDVFNRASLAALDMGNVFGSADAAAMQLGKALDNPTKGVAALAKAGVTFTAQQKEQIAAMQASGDMLGAQKIILAEVEAQVGGTAAATATNADRMKVAFGNLQEGVGAMLLPAMEKFAGVMSASVLPAVQRFADEQLPKIIEAAKPVAAWLGDNLPKAFNLVKDAITTVVTTVQTIWAKWGDDVIRIGGQVSTWLKTNVPPAFEAVKVAIKTVVDNIQAFWSKWGADISATATKVFGAIKEYIGGTMQVIQGVIKTVTSIIKGDWSGVWDGLKQISSGMMTQIQAVIKGGMDAVRLIMKMAWDWIKREAGEAVDGLVGVVKTIPAKIKGAIPKPLEMLSGVGRDVVQGLINGITSKLDALRSVAGKLKDIVTGKVITDFITRSPSRLMYGYGMMVGEGFALGLEASTNLVADAAAGMTQGALEQLEPILKWTVGQAQNGQHATGTGPNGETIQGRPFAANPDGSTMRDENGNPVYADDTATIARVSAQRFGMTSASAQPVQVYVAGSVLSENDLMDTVRKGLAESARLGYA